MNLNIRKSPKRLIINIDSGTLHKLKTLALKRNITLTTLVLGLLDKHILEEQKYD
jgi:hypothetical protein